MGLLEGAMDGRYTVEVGWIEDYGSLLDATIGAEKEAQALNEKETQIHA